MTQLTVRELYEDLGRAVKAGYGNRVLVLADDTEGNSYHGMYYSLIVDPVDIEQLINGSNGLCDSQEKDPTKIAILG